MPFQCRRLPCSAQQPLAWFYVPVGYAARVEVVERHQEWLRVDWERGGGRRGVRLCQQQHVPAAQPQQGGGQPAPRCGAHVVSCPPRFQTSVPYLQDQRHAGALAEVAAVGLQKRPQVAAAGVLRAPQERGVRCLDSLSVLGRQLISMSVLGLAPNAGKRPKPPLLTAPLPSTHTSCTSTVQGPSSNAACSATMFSCAMLPCRRTSLSTCRELTALRRAWWYLRAGGNAGFGGKGNKKNRWGLGWEGLHWHEKWAAAVNTCAVTDSASSLAAHAERSASARRRRAGVDRPASGAPFERHDGAAAGVPRLEHARGMALVQRGKPLEVGDPPDGPLHRRRQVGRHAQQPAAGRRALRRRRRYRRAGLGRLAPRGRLGWHHQGGQCRRPRGWEARGWLGPRPLPLLPLA